MSSSEGGAATSGRETNSGSRKRRTKHQDSRKQKPEKAEGAKGRRQKAESRKQSDTPREAGGLMNWAASKAVGLRV